MDSDLTILIRILKHNPIYVSTAIISQTNHQFYTTWEMEEANSACCFGCYFHPKRHSCTMYLESCFSQYLFLVFWFSLVTVGKNKNHLALGESRSGWLNFSIFSSYPLSKSYLRWRVFVLVTVLEKLKSRVPL